MHLTEFSKLLECQNSMKPGTRILATVYVHYSFSRHAKKCLHTHGISAMRKWHMNFKTHCLSEVLKYTSGSHICSINLNTSE